MLVKSCGPSGSQDLAFVGAVAPLRPEVRLTAAGRYTHYRCARFRLRSKPAIEQRGCWCWLGWSGESERGAFGVAANRPALAWMNDLTAEFAYALEGGREVCDREVRQ